MEIVIKITEEDYERVKKKFQMSMNIMANAIAHGTPLPKGHGALVDRSEVIKNLLDYRKGKKTLGQCIEDVQTIIEADWEDEEE